MSFARLCILILLFIGSQLAFAEPISLNNLDELTRPPRAQKSLEKSKPKESGKACSDNAANSALVVIDMQPYFSTRLRMHEEPANRAKLTTVIDQQIAAIKKAKEAKIPVIFIEYDCGSCDPTDSRLKAVAEGYANVRYIKKSTDGMFSSRNTYLKDLKDFLGQNSVGKLVVTGANGGACVQASIEGALEENCHVVALSTGIADFNYREFIYPYVGKYNYDQCKDCSFKEVASVERASDYMINFNARSPSATKTGNKKSGAR